MRIIIQNIHFYDPQLDSFSPSHLFIFKNHSLDLHRIAIFCMLRSP